MYKKKNSNYVTAGLTGGIASGKSTVAGLFRELGCDIIDADQVARAIVRPGEPALREIAARFGKEILLPDQELDRKKLAEIIFSDKTAKTALDAITHPIILAEMQRKTVEKGKKTNGVIIWDVPLLFEAGFAQYVDASVLVYTPVEIQLERLMRRDGISRNDALKRINSQMPLHQKRELATIIINNSGTISEVKEQVSLVYQELLTYVKD